MSATGESTVGDEGRAHREVNVSRQRREVACLDGYILRQRAVASPVREAEHPLFRIRPLLAYPKPKAPRSAWERPGPLAICVGAPNWL